MVPYSGCAKGQQQSDCGFPEFHGFFLFGEKPMLGLLRFTFVIEILKTA
jgi:hypothetical protein